MLGQRSFDGGVSKIPLRARDGSIRAYAFVDLDDIHRVNRHRWSWHSTGGAVSQINNKQIHLARFILGIIDEKDLFPVYQNKNKLDCRKENLCVRRHHKTKQRGANLRRKFGIDEAEYDELLEAQKGMCAICSYRPVNRSLAVDHCHETGEIRGLLCFACNTAIGKFNHDPALLLLAIRYLE